MKHFGNQHQRNNGERGAALAIAVVVVAILSVVALTALAFSSTEARLAGSDLQRAQAFYASSSGLEKMTNDFSNLFRRKMNPTSADLTAIAGAPPPELLAEGYTFTQQLTEDTAKLNELRTLQGLPSTVYPRVNIPDGPFSGLYASIIPYRMSSIAARESTRTEVKLEREFNNYLVPLFQFGMFSNDDIELHPGPLLTFNGRIHTNGNFYALSSSKFYGRVTTAGEYVRDVFKGGELNMQGGKDAVSFVSGGIEVFSTMGAGSVKPDGSRPGGPNLPGSAPGLRGYFPGSPNGVANPLWETDSIKPVAATVANNFGGQLLTQTTGATPLKLPLELAGNSPAEIIKRTLPSDNDILSSSRYHAKSTVRILIDDETAGSGSANAAGIPAGKGLLLSQFTPSALNGGPNVLKLIANNGNVSGSDVTQVNPDGTTATANVVRGVKSAGETAGGNYVPPGSGVRGRIYIEVVKPDGTTVDVTQTILSMGVTVGEPNGIVYLQRPLWSAYVQGGRDRTGGSYTLQELVNNSQIAADAEMTDPSAMLVADRGYITTTLAAANDDASGIVRQATPTGVYNSVVPINVYNVREGWIDSSTSQFDLYRRGVTSVIDINMRNMARWLDGVYDANLLAGTAAVSSNIQGTEGYVIYLSDRRGDRVKSEYLPDGTAYASTNGIVDNEDIYGQNGLLEPGEDVIDFGWNADGSSKKGSLQKDTLELPDSGTICCAPTPTNAPLASRLTRANDVLATFNANNLFRRSFRLFNGDVLSTSAAAGKLSPTKGITIASENMLYLWGNYNATGIAAMPTTGSTLNDGGYNGPQVPASVVCDAFFPVSRTWFDASSALYPEVTINGAYPRMADDNWAGAAQSTTVRMALLAGATISAITGSPGRNAAGQRRNGGIHNFPRFLEQWRCNSNDCPWNYTGSIVPLFHSTQALSQFEDAGGNIYYPPRRNWSFDQTFATPQKLPPGTPFFQYVQASGFRQSFN